jgi:hypothetical protein
MPSREAHIAVTRGGRRRYDPQSGDIPPPVRGNAIVHQYFKKSGRGSHARDKTHFHDEDLITCSLTFQSSDATVIKLGFSVSDMEHDEDELPMSLEEMSCEVFSQAFRTIRDHPLLSHVKRLHIKHDTDDLWIPPDAALWRTRLGDYSSPWGPWTS